MLIVDNCLNTQATNRSNDLNKISVALPLHINSNFLTLSVIRLVDNYLANEKYPVDQVHEAVAVSFQ